MARRRLTLLRDTDDGFLIADEDFRLRGGGDTLGTRQAGLPGYRLADPVEHEHLLHMAHRDAAVLLSRDPNWKRRAGKRSGCCCGCSSGQRPCARWRLGRGVTAGLFVQQSEVITPAIFRNWLSEDPAGTRFLEILAEETLLPVVRCRLVVHRFRGKFHRSSRLRSDY